MNARCGAFAFVLLATAISAQSVEQDNSAAVQDTRFDSARLDQIVAPIALYPDALLMQIFMAATYPLEIVEADRFVLANSGLSGPSLEAALADRDWDPSVKSLTAVPTVLRRLSENLDWTRDLGDAFLAQRPELLDAVQRMRTAALDAGNLRSSPQETVTVREDRIVVIDPVDPNFICVPTYSPLVVYGRWGYPYYYYPALYVPPAPGYGFITFGVGFPFGSFWFGRADWHWGHSDVLIDVNIFDRHRGRFHRVEPPRHVEGGFAHWEHDSDHRRGVRYQSHEVERRFPQPPRPWRLTPDQARGHDRTPSPPMRPEGRTPARSEGPSPRPDRRPDDVPRPDNRTPPREGPREGPRQVPREGPREAPRGGGVEPPRPAPPPPAPRTNVPAPQPTRPSPNIPRSDPPRGAFGGVQSPGLDRAASNRGSQSRLPEGDNGTHQGQNAKPPH